MNVTTDELLMLLGRYVMESYAAQRDLGEAQKKLARLLMEPGERTLTEDHPHP